MFFNHIPASILFSATVGSNTLHLRNQTNGFDCTILWGDGQETIVPVNGGNIAHNYSVAGDYNIQITGKSFAGFYVNNQIGRDKYKELYSMGKWENDTFITCDFLFEGCNNLVNLSSNLFKFNPLIKSAFRTFKNCTKLSNIPDDLFKYNIGIIGFHFTFEGCSNLEFIPPNLFKYNINITNLNGTFMKCEKLKSIPFNLFSSNIQIRDFSSIFDSCYSLNIIPNELFYHNINAIDFDSIFSECTNLKEIPIDLFKYNIKAKTFKFAFYSCENIEFIPDNLFRSNIEVTTFFWTFCNCINLKEVPIDLFKYNINSINFNSTFADCPIQIKNNIFGLEYKNRFKNIKEPIDFIGCFSYDNVVENRGAAPDLWNFDFNSIPETMGCFGGLANESLSNYVDVPDDWK